MAIVTLLDNNAAWETTILGASNKDPLGTVYEIPDFPVEEYSFLESIDQHRPFDSVLIDNYEEGFSYLLRYDDGGANIDRDYNDMVLGVDTHVPMSPVPLPDSGWAMLGLMISAVYLGWRKNTLTSKEG